MRQQKRTMQRLSVYQTWIGVRKKEDLQKGFGLDM